MHDLTSPDEPASDVVRDDQLRLIFTCCHPALAPEARVALALRVLCGLSAARIASVLQTTEPAIAKRLTRTRSKIAVARTPTGCRPSTSCRHGSRRCAASSTGCTRQGTRRSMAPRPSTPARPRRPCGSPDRCTSSCRTSPCRPRYWPTCCSRRRAGRPAWARTVTRSPSRSRTARAGTRMPSPRGSLCSPTRSVDSGRRRPLSAPGRHRSRACPAPRWRDTDWDEVLRLYDLLLSVAPSPAAAMGRAVAMAEAAGPDVGLAALEDLPTTPLWHALRAELLARAGRTAEAIEALARSLDAPSAVRNGAPASVAWPRWATACARPTRCRPGPGPQAEPGTRWGASMPRSSLRRSEAPVFQMAYSSESASAWAEAAMMLVADPMVDHRGFPRSRVDDHAGAGGRRLGAVEDAHLVVHEVHRVELRVERESALRSAASSAFTGPLPSAAVCSTSPSTSTLTVASASSSRPSRCSTGRCSPRSGRVPRSPGSAGG